MCIYEWFGSQEAAAEDWAWNYYGASRYTRFEQASLIYMTKDADGDWSYSYTYSVYGEPHSVDPYNAEYLLPSEVVVVGIVHSHHNSEDISEVDKAYARNKNAAIFAAVPASYYNNTTVKKYGNTRKEWVDQGEIATDIVYNLIDQFKKDQLRATFQKQWNTHISWGSCPQEFGCENFAWPTGIDKIKRRST